jgi:SAM-dependent methyltransferase
MVERTFDELVGEAATAPIHGWDFAWLDGRATEERPTWGYSGLVAERIESSLRMLDLECGGAELLGELPAFPQFLVATEGWMPNATIAVKTLSTRGGHLVIAAGEYPVIPFVEGSFDLVTSRHPVRTWWHEVARVLIPDGTFLSQQVGPGTVRELREFMMGPQPRGSSREPQLAKASAQDAGLEVLDLRSQRLRTVFRDIGAVVYFLRLAVWIVPDFSVEGYRGRLLALHHHIGHEGPFVAHAARFLIVARRRR